MNGVIEALKEEITFVSDHNRVYKSWTGGSDEMSSFIEVKCGFLDDYLLKHIIEENPTNLNNNIINLLTTLKNVLNKADAKFGPFTHPKVVLKSNEWKTVEKICSILKKEWVDI